MSSFFAVPNAGRVWGNTAEKLWKKEMKRQKRTILRELIKEATVDAHGDEEQEGAFLVMLEESLPTPFKALVVGEEVEVTGVDQGVEDRGIMAICKRKGKKYRVSITSLEWAGKPPEGSEWIEVYKVWIRGGW